jgi:hypothetical protein
MKILWDRRKDHTRDLVKPPFGVMLPLEEATKRNNRALYDLSAYQHSGCKA